MRLVFETKAVLVNVMNEVTETWMTVVVAGQTENFKIY